MTSNLDDRRILVTGATSGIGQAVARSIAEHGGRVALLARREEPLRDLASELGGVAVPADVTDVDAARAAVDAAADGLGGLDGVVNAAGVLRGGSFAETDPADWKVLFDVNVLGLLHVTQAAIPHVTAAAGVAGVADVVNVSSMSGRRLGTNEMAAYAASKAAVHMLTEGLRRELQPQGVRVSVLAPGFVRTGLFDAGAGYFGARMRERAEDVGLEVAEVAAAVVYLLAAPAGVVHPELAILSRDQ